MSIEDMTIKQCQKIAEMFGETNHSAPIFTGMIGKFVIVRCHDAGVHAGVLVSHQGRECVLEEARRLWYWKPANGASFLSGVATEGLHDDSKIGDPVRVHLTENCEIIECSEKSEKSIRAKKGHKQ